MVPRVPVAAMLVVYLVLAACASSATSRSPHTLIRFSIPLMFPLRSASPEAVGRGALEAAPDEGGSEADFNWSEDIDEAPL